MKAQVLLRKVHFWGAAVIALPVLVTVVTGLLLLVKKEVAWIQPPTQTGHAPKVMAERTLAEMFGKAQSVPEANIQSWADLKRVDVKPRRGIVKFVAQNNWEVQIDTATGSVLQVAYRRSDLIEALHDGSFFAGWTKLGLWLPAGLGLLILWLTGVYLFALLQWKRWRQRRRRVTKVPPSMLEQRRVAGRSIEEKVIQT